MNFGIRNTEKRAVLLTFAACLLAVSAIALNIPATELNGARRAAMLAFVVGVIAVVVCVFRRFNNKTTKITLPRVVAVGAYVMGALAFMVRIPCRASSGYYIGCGVNGYMVAGLLLSATIAITGIYLAWKHQVHLGWAVAAWSLYYVDYMQDFLHVTPVAVRVGFFALLMTMVVTGVRRVWQQRHLRKQLPMRFVARVAPPVGSKISV